MRLQTRRPVLKCSYVLLQIVISFRPFVFHYGNAFSSWEQRLFFVSSKVHVRTLFVAHVLYNGRQEGKEGFDANDSSPHFADCESFVGTDPFAKAPKVYFSQDY